MSMFVLGPLRKEMKERVDELLRAQREVTDAVNGLSAAINGLDGSKLGELTDKWLQAAGKAAKSSASVEDTLTKISDVLR